MKCLMMTPLKMWCLLPLSVLLLLSVTPTDTKFMNSMSNCNKYLLQKTPPHISGVLEDGNIKDQKRYKPICRSYKNMRSAVMLYDSEDGIPVFSAYKFTGAKSNQLETPWNRELFPEGRNLMSNIWGHFFPSSGELDELDKIIPQVKTVNTGSWKHMETCVKCILEEHCINNINIIEGYVVSGAVSGTDIKLNNNIHKPSVFWSAFCCYSKGKNKWLASAYWGENTAEKSNGEYLPTKTLKELKDNLKIVAFPKTNCPQSETVANIYPEMKKSCQCPPKPKLN
ncbi:uncharacterized protein LOC113168650 [Anabas testudineus]|uniref:DNA/RNA non-specific endonuclease/pyrophosphatase/phosphodiesterase domain-containing protein n=1 Tax=Anabas testudineus TaxID=64144 RepID=A0A3Q1IK74_ANATE|nr:uncharacterized protein LOC113168650 [Anabas testudineus]